MSDSQEPPKPIRPKQVLSLGLFKTGSYSIYEALTILGYKDVHHGMTMLYTPEQWPMFDRAAQATFPSLPTYTGQPFTREDWDTLFGPCEAITDYAGVFAIPLVQAYPEAKVILVERDIDKWYNSVEESVLGRLYGPLGHIFTFYVEPLIGTVAGKANRNILLGWTESDNVQGIRMKLKPRYKKHYDDVRAVVSREKLLEYKLGSGWGPLCDFLGKEIPDEPFPHSNEAAVMRQKIVTLQKDMLSKAVQKHGPAFLVVAGLILALWLKY